MKRFFMKPVLLLMGASLLISLGGCGKKDSESKNNVALEQETQEESQEEIQEETEQGNSQETDQEVVDDTKTTEVGEFSSFTSYDLAGNEVTQEVLAEADLTVLNIWGTFCGPCIREMPDLGEIAEEYKDKGVQIIGLASDVYDESDIEKANEIIEKTNANYLHLLPTQDLYDIYLKNVMAIPETLFLDKDGYILDSITGARDKETWISLIDAALEDLQ